MAVKSKTAMKAENTANITTNASGDITGAILNALVVNLIDSYQDVLTSYTTAQITALIAAGALVPGNFYYNTDNVRLEFFDGSTSRFIGDTHIFSKVYKAQGNTDVNAVENDDWQQIEAGGDLLIQKREAAAWVTKEIVNDGGIAIVTSSPYSITNDYTVLVDDDTIGGAATINLPAASGFYFPITIKKLGNTANVIIDGQGSETIDGSLTITLTLQNESVTLITDQTNWFII